MSISKMFSNFILCNVIFHLVFLSSASSEDHLEHSPPHLLKRVRRVVGGYETDIENVPYLVNIRKNGKFHCGGSLLTPKCVLTAAHCLRDNPKEHFAIRGGVTFLSDLRYKRVVERIILHPKFNKRNLNRDLAILKLNSSLEGPHIETIKLNKEPLLVNQSLTVSGWGLTEEGNKEPSNHLRSVKLNVMSKEQCQQLYADFRLLTPQMFCTSSQTHKDACVADSGGPAVNEQGQLVGVVSWGRKSQCARAESPGVYVNVRTLLSWINRTLQEQQC